MNFKEAEEYIDYLKNRGIVPGLENITKLCEVLGNPQNKTKIIHIAGTNGKGSVGAFISSVLIEAGYNVGRYISPAVEDRREVYQYNGNWIDEKSYAECIDIVKNGLDKLEKEKIFPTSFEAETAAAFVYFQMKKCDYAIVECGMGGKTDATNVILCPVCSVITSISIDHAAFLGDTIEKIAEQKAGIIKRNSKAVCARNPIKAEEIIEKKCKALDVPLKIVEKAENVQGSINGVEFEYDGQKFRTRLAGLYQADNAVTAIETIKMLDLNISEEVIRRGIENTDWKYRFEVQGKWVFDGAHNPDGAKKLAETIDAYFMGKRLIYIFGVFRDKEYDKISEITSGRASKIYTIKPPTSRGLESEILAEAVRKYNKCEVIAEDIETAVELSRKADCDAIICFGSLSFLSRLKSALEVE